MRLWQLQLVMILLLALVFWAIQFTGYAFMYMHGGAKVAERCAKTSDPYLQSSCKGSGF